MSDCGPRMEIVRQLDLKSTFPDITKILNGLGVAPRSPYAPLRTLGFVLDHCLNVGIFSGKFNGCFLCRISRLCSDSWGTRSCLLISLCKLGFIVD
jgi:hypothetical protein